jgi:hypothetical protein
MLGGPQEAATVTRQLATNPTIPPVDDTELCAEALAADPDLSVAPDAVSFWELTGDGPGTVLPAWYMPAPMRAPKLTGWRRHLVRGNVVLIVASFVAINCAGLCNTYGQLHF